MGQAGQDALGVFLHNNGCSLHIILKHNVPGHGFHQVLHLRLQHVEAASGDPTETATLRWRETLRWHEGRFLKPGRFAATKIVTKWP